MSVTGRKPRKTREERQAEREAQYALMAARGEAERAAQERRWRTDRIVRRLAGFRYWNASIDNGCSEHGERENVATTCLHCGCPFCKRVVGHSEHCVVLEAEALILEAEKPEDSNGGDR